jgi:coiled-coil domain-containing protein 63/114
MCGLSVGYISFYFFSQPEMSKRESSKEDLPTQRVLRQRELIETLRHNNEILKLDLTKESRENKRTSSSGAIKDITRSKFTLFLLFSSLSSYLLVLSAPHLRLQEQSSTYLRRIEEERRQIEDLDSEIASYQEKILDQKARMGGINASWQNNQMIQKQIRVLENRLDKCLLKFNDTLAQNKSLRLRIDEYRRERVVFDGIYKKLERELHEKKKEMSAIIEDSKNAFQARDKAQSEMVALQQHAEKERNEFESEFNELGEMIKQQQGMLEQLRLKQLETTQETQIAQTISRDEMNKNEIISNSNWNATNSNKNILPLTQEKINSYEEALHKIQEGTGIYDIHEIVSRFLEAEEQNFSLFNYVNDINSEIERLEHSIADMRNQIEKYRGQGMSTDTQRKKALRDLEEKLYRTEKKADEYDSRYQRAVRTISQLKNGIHSIFTRIGAASTSVEEMLGNQGVTESNMMQYLGIIEQRTSEILQAYAASQIGQPNEQSLQLPSVMVADSPSKLNVMAPSYEDMSSGEDSDSEEDERPLTRQELDKRTLREFSRKGNGNLAGGVQRGNRGENQ